MKRHVVNFLLSAILTISLAFASFVTSFIPNNAFANTDDLGSLTSLADIIEPLMPAVVNIYTVKYNKKRQSRGNPFPELIPFEEFDDFFKRFNMPFGFDLYSSSPKAMSLGSGFIIDETGLIVTNNHVIAGSDEIHVKLSDSNEFPAIVIGRDPKTDLALIKIQVDKKLPFVSFGNSSETRVGDVVIAIGNSLGFGGTVTSGIISSKGRDLGSGMDELVDDFIQTDAAINTGNSGGPLFDITGKVIGVNTAIPAVAGGTNVGIGFAIPSNRVQSIINQLKESGKISRGRLDIAIQEITKELSEALSLNKDYGVLVVDVKPGGSGDKAGLKRGDLITEFNDKKVLNSRKLQLFVAETKVDDEIKLTVIRDTKSIVLKTRMTEVKEEEERELEDKISGSAQPKNTNSNKSLLEKSGIVLTELTDDLKNQFNIDKSVQGLFVVDVKIDENTKADSVENYKINIGDVILSIDHQSVNSLKEFNSIYEKIKSGNKKTTILLVKRRDFSMFIVLPIK